MAQAAYLEAGHPPVLGQGRVAADRGADHRQQQDHRLGDRHDVGRPVEHDQHVRDQHQREGREHRAEAAALAAADPGAAEDRRGEDEEQHAAAHQRVAGAGLGAEEDPARAVEGAGQRVAQELGPRDRDAVGEGGVLVAADGIERGAEARALDERPDAERQQDDQGRGGEAVGDQVAGEDHREAVGDVAPRVRHQQQVEAEDDEHHRQRHDHRLQPAVGDEEAVDRADRRPDAEAGEAHQHLAPEGIRGVQRHDDVDERQHGAAGEVEAADQEHHRLAHGGEGERAGIGRDEADLEIADRARRDHVQADDDAGEGHDRDQQAPVARQPLLPGEARQGPERNLAHRTAPAPAGAPAGACACVSVPSASRSAPSA